MKTPTKALEIELSNPDKIFWPAEGFTKFDLFDYYRAIAPFILPYLRDRPADSISRTTPSLTFGLVTYKGGSGAFTSRERNWS